jgi:hypothetical protein
MHAKKKNKSNETCYEINDVIINLLDIRKSFQNGNIILKIEDTQGGSNLPTSFCLEGF